MSDAERLAAWVGDVLHFWKYEHPDVLFWLILLVLVLGLLLVPWNHRRKK